REYILDFQLDKFVSWARSNSLQPLVVAPACCAGVLDSTIANGAPDLFAKNIFSVSPDQADLLIISGPVNDKMIPVLKNWHSQMPAPSRVIVFGACSTGGGFFADYGSSQKISEILPVDIKIKGCPPTAEDLKRGLNDLKKLIKTETTSQKIGQIFKNRLLKILRWFKK
ncbi:MAG: NADH-quinone oxidoreductase subunit B, partial [bacterium]